MSKFMPSIAIIGAGISGLAAAHILQDAGFSVTLFEKSPGVGGRATTRKRDGFIYDHGAQYIKGGSPLSTAFITERFRLPDLIDIDKSVWIFDSQGNIQEGDSVQNADPKWNYRSGLLALAERMAEGLDVRLERGVGHVQQEAIGSTTNRGPGYVSQPHTTPGQGQALPLPYTVTGAEGAQQETAGWSLFDVVGQFLGHFEQVVVTIPATQAAELIEASAHRWRRERPHPASAPPPPLQLALSEARYNPLLSVMLGYKTRPRTRPYYALVNSDKAHAISWLAWEHEKAAERVPDDAGLFIAQMSPQYTLDHWETADEEIMRDVAARVATLIDEPLSDPIFTDVQRWRDALPSEKANADELNAIGLPIGLAFCGDGYVGGRVHLALEHGIRVAHQIVSYL